MKRLLAMLDVSQVPGGTTGTTIIVPPEQVPYETFPVIGVALVVLLLVAAVAVWRYAVAR